MARTILTDPEDIQYIDEVLSKEELGTSWQRIYEGFTDPEDRKVIRSLNGDAKDFYNERSPEKRVERIKKQRSLANEKKKEMQEKATKTNSKLLNLARKLFLASFTTKLFNIKVDKLKYPEVMQKLAVHFVTIRKEFIQVIATMTKGDEKLSREIEEKAIDLLFKNFFSPIALVQTGNNSQKEIFAIFVACHYQRIVFGCNYGVNDEEMAIIMEKMKDDIIDAAGSTIEEEFGLEKQEVKEALAGSLDEDILPELKTEVSKRIAA